MVRVSAAYNLLLVASAVLIVAAKSHLESKYYRGEKPGYYRTNEKKPSADFVIEDRKIGGILHSKVILNELTGERAEVVVDYGGRIEDLVLASQRDGKPWPVLLTHNDNATAIVENKWWMGMPLIPWANRIAYGKYTFFNKTHQLPLNEDTPELKNALHGLLDGVIMEVRSTNISNESAQLVLGYQTDGSTGYPFQFDLEISYTLSSLHYFAVNIHITNLKLHDPLPLYVGWHPYFVCTVYRAYVILDQCTGWNYVEVNANKDPTGITVEFHGFNGSDPIGGNSTNPTFYDNEYKPKKGTDLNCFTLETRIVDTATNHTIHLHQDENFRFVHIFTGLNGAVAVEPMSGMADAYNNHDHLTVLSGREEWTGSFWINIDSYH